MHDKTSICNLPNRSEFVKKHLVFAGFSAMGNRQMRDQFSKFLAKNRHTTRAI